MTLPSVDDIIRYEQGEMSDDEIIEFFQGLIDSGACWTLQGHYGRTAASLIEQGLCVTPRQREKAREEREALYAAQRDYNERKKR